MSDPSAVARMQDQLDVFRTNDDGRVSTAWWHAGNDWVGWPPIGGFFPPAAPVTSVARTANNLDLFICGNDGRVYTSWWYTGANWSGVNDNWRSIGGFFPPGAEVSAVARTGNNLDLFVVGNDGRVYTSWWSAGADWSGVNDNWRPIGGFFPPAARIAAVARTGTNLDLFVVGNDGRVYTSWWSAGADWSGVNDNWMVVPPSIRLNFNMQAQTQTNWCWAATSTSVAHYYDPASTWTQCEVANGEKGQTTCCVNGSSALCNAYGTLDTSLNRVGHFDHMAVGTISFGDVTRQMRLGRPVCARIAWSGGGAHFMAIIGSLGGDLYAVDDPIYGKSDVSEATFKTAYHSTGTWTHTYFTR